MWACSATPEPPPFSPSQSTAGWWTGAELLTPRQEHGVVSIGGEIVVVGGVDAGPITGGWVEAFDPRVGSWRRLPELPVVMHHPNVASVDDHIYVLGALDSAFRPIPAYWMLTPDADGWTELPGPPPSRVVGSAGVGVIGGQIHLVGGLQGDAVALHSVFDTTSKTWTALPDAPHARDHLAAAFVDGVLVVTGGRQRTLDAFVADTDLWFVDGGWEAGAPIPTPRGGVAAVAHQGQLHVFGGEGNPDDASGVFATHEAYDPSIDAWTRYEDMPAPRHGMGAAVVDDVIWVPGGAPVDAFGAVATNQGWIE